MTSLELHLHTRFDLGCSSSRTGSGIFSFDPFTFFFLVRGGGGLAIASFLMSHLLLKPRKLSSRSVRVGRDSVTTGRSTSTHLASEKRRQGTHVRTFSPFNIPLAAAKHCHATSSPPSPHLPSHPTRIVILIVSLPDSYLRGTFLFVLVGAR
jgi:hypothetical protein